MGVVFKCGNRVVWDPSPPIAFAFLAQVKALEAMIGSRSEPSWIGDAKSGTIHVDPEALRQFVTALSQQLQPGLSHQVTSLVAGPFALAAGILAACERNSPTFIGKAGDLARRGTAIVSNTGQRGPIYENLGGIYHVHGKVFSESLEKIEQALSSGDWHVRIEDNQLEMDGEDWFIRMGTLDEARSGNREFIACGDLNCDREMASELLASISKLLVNAGIRCNLDFSPSESVS